MVAGPCKVARAAQDCQEEKNSRCQTDITKRVKVAVNTIVPRSPFFLFLYLKTQTVTHTRKNAVEYLRQWNGAICVIYNLCQRQKIR